MGLRSLLQRRKPFEDLFGGISIIMRASIRVGDYCRVADQTGIIEDIGLSSTRLRTLDRTVVSIPNARIAAAEFREFRVQRQVLWFHHILSLRYDTSKTQIERVLAEMHAVIEKHARG